MAGPLSLAVLDGGPRHGERITVAGGDDGEPPRLLEVPDRAAGPGSRDRAPPAASRYRLAGHDMRRNAHIYTYLSPVEQSRPAPPPP